MWHHAFGAYMRHAFPDDELKPLSCTGRKWNRRSRGTLDDALGGFSLTAVDALQSQALLGDLEGFERTAKLVIETVHFDRDVSVSVFESIIRVLGGLLAAHVTAAEHIPAARNATGANLPDSRWQYSGELLTLARDLGDRLLPAFDSATGLPFHLVNLKHGATPKLRKGKASCSAAAGTAVMEMGLLSYLTGDTRYSTAAARAAAGVWRRRNPSTRLVAADIDVASGKWRGPFAGVGAGIDSFYEYLLKGWAMFGVDDLWEAWHEAASATNKHLLVWERFGALPEAWDAGSDAPISFAKDSPLRPELIESAYHLFTATHDSFYVQYAARMMSQLNARSKVACGYASVADVRSGRLDDRMDSFFLSETAKYLFMTFDAALQDMAYRQQEAAVAAQMSAALSSSLDKVKNVTVSVPARAEPAAAVAQGESGAALAAARRRTVEPADPSPAATTQAGPTAASTGVTEAPEAVRLLGSIRDGLPGMVAALRPDPLRHLFSTEGHVFPVVIPRNRAETARWRRVVRSIRAGFQAPLRPLGTSGTAAKPPPANQALEELADECPVWAEGLSAVGADSGTPLSPDQLAGWSVGSEKHRQALAAHAAADAHAGSSRGTSELRSWAIRKPTKGKKASRKQQHVVAEGSVTVSAEDAQKPVVLMLTRSDEGEFVATTHADMLTRIVPHVQERLQSAAVPGLSNIVIKCEEAKPGSSIHKRLNSNSVLRPVDAAASADPVVICRVLADLPAGAPLRLDLTGGLAQVTRLQASRRHYWPAKDVCAITPSSPQCISQTVALSGAVFGQPLIPGMAISAPLAFAWPPDACVASRKARPLQLLMPVRPAADDDQSQSPIAVAVRGGCSFVAKARAAQAAGAMGLIVLDLEEEEGGGGHAGVAAGLDEVFGAGMRAALREAQLASSFSMADDGTAAGVVLPSGLARGAAADAVIRWLGIESTACAGPGRSGSDACTNRKALAKLTGRFSDSGRSGRSGVDVRVRGPALTRGAGPAMGRLSMLADGIGSLLPGDDKDAVTAAAWSSSGPDPEEAEVWRLGLPLTQPLRQCPARLGAWGRGLARVQSAHSLSGLRGSTSVANGIVLDPAEVVGVSHAPVPTGAAGGPIADPPRWRRTGHVLSEMIFKLVQDGDGSP